MKAMVLDRIAPIATAPLSLVEWPVPQPGPGEILLRVSCCAICQTDLHVIEGELPRQRLPLIPGHQIVGTVAALGADCHELAVGRRAGIAWLRHTCGDCPFCTAGRENLCEVARFTGYHADGGYAEFAVVPEAFAYEIAAEEAAPLLCAGIISATGH
jgi:propanol-preferring alcohol dehydrogenase